MWLSFIVLIGSATGEYLRLIDWSAEIQRDTCEWFFFFFFYIYISALWVVYMTQDPNSLPAYRSFPITLFSQFELSMGLIDLPVDHTIITPPMIHVLHFTFTMVSCILLLNLLIAMMSDTHWRVAQERDELWRIQVPGVVQKSTWGACHSGMCVCVQKITQLLWNVPGCCYNINAGEEAAALPVASTRSVRPGVRSEGTLVS